MHCTNCGAQLDDQATYCGYCGAPVGKREESYSASSVPPPSPYGMVSEEDRAAVKKRRRNVIFIGLGVVAAVAVTVVLVYFFLYTGAGSLTTLKCYPADGYQASHAQLVTAAGGTKARLEDLGIKNVSVWVNRDSFTVRFPKNSGDYNKEAVKAQIETKPDLYFKSDTYNEGKAFITGADILSATVNVDSNAEYCVNLKMNAVGAEKLSAATRELAASYGQLSIYLSGRTISTASVQSEISGGEAVISGGFTAVSAKRLADEINLGALPFTLVTKD